MRISAKEKQMREKARKIITQKIDDLCKIHGYTYNRIAIRNQKTRLGSCSSKKNLNFNWQIIKFPEKITDYIIKHEIAHLAHQNHSKAFWSEVKKLDPDYKINHKWLRKNGHKFLSF